MSYLQKKFKRSRRNLSRTAIASAVVLLVFEVICAWFSWIIPGIVILFCGIVLLALIGVFLLIVQFKNSHSEEHFVEEEEKVLLGQKKKSFVLNYNNGTIWCEHLDSLLDQEEIVLDKLKGDLQTLNGNNMPSFVAVTLDETKTSKELLSQIATLFMELRHPIRKICFIGLDHSAEKTLSRLFSSNMRTNFIYSFTDDFEKAKEWLVSNT